MLGSYQSSRKAGKYILAQLLLLGRLFPTGGGAVVLKRLKITKGMHYQEESGHLEQLMSMKMYFGNFINLKH